MQKNEVNEAFEILLEELEVVIDLLNEAGAEAFKKSDYEKVKESIERATQITEFREKVKSLQKEWANLYSVRLEHPKKRKRKTLRKLSKGLRTPEDAFRRPILESLIELGGSAPMKEVLDLVEKKMKGVLNKYDYQPLPSDPKSKRWRNTAQWCRNTLVREGLLKGDSPYGIWEISNKGRDEVFNLS